MFLTAYFTVHLFIQPLLLSFYLIELSMLVSMNTLNLDNTQSLPSRNMCGVQTHKSMSALLTEINILIELYPSYHRQTKEETPKIADGEAQAMSEKCSTETDS
jgi:hypothetical protein